MSPLNLLLFDMNDEYYDHSKCHYGCRDLLIIGQRQGCGAGTGAGAAGADTFWSEPGPDPSKRFGRSRSRSRSRQKLRLQKGIQLWQKKEY